MSSISTMMAAVAVLTRPKFDLSVARTLSW
jgi:hypothetical protein